jgi:hypothetical protein
MKKTRVCIYVVFFLVVVMASSVNANNIYSHFGQAAKASVSPRAVFDKLWIDYDITEDGVKGMRIHVKFTVYEMKFVDSYMAIFFENDKDNRLRDKNKKFNSSGGDVALYKSIKPEYDPAVYDNLQIFMPYSELDLDPGKYALTMVVKLIYANGDPIQDLTSYDFDYTKPGSNTALTGAPAATATFEDLWVDYDVTENGRRGMRIHVKFRVLNMKNVDSYLAIYFEKKNGEKLKTTRTGYKSEAGQVAVYKSLLPAYDEAVYSDIAQFMPYEELNLGSGKFDLKMDADVIYKNGDIVKHLKYYDFIFTQ